MKRGPVSKIPAPSYDALFLGFSYYPAAAACERVCVHSPVSEGVTVSSLPEKPMSSALELYWMTPCSFKTWPVLPTCEPLGHRLTLLPLLETENDGEDLPLVTLDSPNPCPTCARAGAAATTTIATIAPNNTNFFNFSTSLDAFLELGFKVL